MLASPKAHPVWFESRFPGAEECSLRSLLETAATQRPDDLFAIFEDGSRWTCAETLAVVRRTAAGLQATGVSPGDVVLSWLPNGPDLIRTWFAISYIGAIYSPLHTAYKGPILEGIIGNSGARLLVAHYELVSRLVDIDTSGIETVVAIGGDAAAPDGLRVLTGIALDGDPDMLKPGAMAEPWDIAAVVYTSGTTGQSKGVLVPYGQLWTIGEAFFGYMGRDDRMMVVTPLCHIGPISGIVGALTRKAAVIVIEGFQSRAFWSQTRAFGATTVPGLSPTVLKFVLSTISAEDREGLELRTATVSRVNVDAMRMAEELGVTYHACFGMTEASLILISEPNCGVVNTCGRPRDGLSIQLVDAHDREVAEGAVGELVVRPDLPWTMNAGYHRDPEATARAWRNGWFHTGDLFRRDAEGYYYFVDRAKDVIRRRGENISAGEIESVALQIDGVRDVAAVGVPGTDGDEEVLLVASALEGRELEPERMLRELLDKLPHFMVPRYYRIVDEIPKTASNKARKVQLRDGLDIGQCWDREQVVSVRRERLSPLRGQS